MLVIRVINLILLGLLIGGAIMTYILFLRNRQILEDKSKTRKAEIPPDAGLRDLILEGRIDEAIDLYRRFTGVDEFTAKQAVVMKQRELRLSKNRDHFRQILASDGKVAAVEAYQSETGAKLAEALEYVESLEKETS